MMKHSSKRRNIDGAAREPHWFYDGASSGHKDIADAMMEHASDRQNIDDAAREHHRCYDGASLGRRDIVCAMMKHSPDRRNINGAASITGATMEHRQAADTSPELQQSTVEPSEHHRCCDGA